MSFKVKNLQLSNDALQVLNTLIEQDINASAAFKLTRILKYMEIEFTIPDPKAAVLQSLFNQTDKETISLLMKELDKAQIKAENLEIELEELRMLYDENSNPHHKDGR
jgi:hypothetical protein